MCHAAACWPPPLKTTWRLRRAAMWETGRDGREEAGDCFDDRSLLFPPLASGELSETTWTPDRLLLKGQFRPVLVPKKRISLWAAAVSYKVAQIVLFTSSVGCISCLSRKYFRLMSEASYELKQQVNLQTGDWVTFNITNTLLNSGVFVHCECL